MWPKFLKPTPIIYLVIEKIDPFIYLIDQNIDPFIYCPLIFYNQFIYCPLIYGYSYTVQLCEKMGPFIYFYLKIEPYSYIGEAEKGGYSGGTSYYVIYR